MMTDASMKQCRRIPCNNNHRYHYYSNAHDCAKELGKCDVLVCYLPTWWNKVV